MVAQTERLKERECVSMPRELTIAEVEQAATVLVPIVQQALRPEFHAMNERFNARHLELQADFTGRINRLEAAVDAKLAAQAAAHKTLAGEVEVIQRNTGKWMKVVGWVMAALAMLAAFAKDWVVGGVKKLMGH